MTIDDISIGKFSALQFSEGINLATFANTPQNRQAASLAALEDKYTTLNRDKLRYIVMIENGDLKKHYKIDDIKTPRADIQALEQQPGASVSTIKQTFDRYLTLKADQSHLMSEAQAVDDQIWQTNKPLVHHYRVTALGPSSN